jgi:hypothetical protein
MLFQQNNGLVDEFYLFRKNEDDECGATKAQSLKVAQRKL